jgi:hypothetical protein
MITVQKIFSMSDENILRYTDLAAVIQMAKSRGWATSRIVGEMSSGLTYAESLKLARKAAPLLDISVMQFMRMRKN